MRKPLLIVLIAAIVVFIGSSLVLYQKLQQRTAEYTTLQADEQATRQRYNDAINEIAAIQDSLDAIVLGEDGARALATELGAEKSLSQARGEEALARISMIKAGIERARDRIQALEAQLQESNVKTAGLEKMVHNLRKAVAEKEEIIVQLTQRVEELQTQVTGLTAEVQAGQQTIQLQAVTIQSQAMQIEDTRRALGTVYYTIGEKDELKDAGIIVGKGGILGLGKTWKPSGQIDETRFTPLDTDQERVIRIPAEEARIISAQPLASYELQPVGDQLELRILDPQAFRTVKHVIIMTD